MIFAIIGYMAHTLNVNIDEVATQGKETSQNDIRFVI